MKKIIPVRVAKVICILAIIVSVYYAYNCIWHFVQMKGCETSSREYRYNKSYSYEDRDFKATIMKAGADAHESAMYEDMAKALGFILIGFGFYAMRKEKT